MDSIMASPGSCDYSSQQAIYQYLISLWISVKNYPQGFLLNLTLYDFANRWEEVDEDTTMKTGHICIRIRKDYDETYSRVFTFSPWEIKLFLYFFNNLRSHWMLMASTDDLKVSMTIIDPVYGAYTGCDEVKVHTERFIVNSRGKIGGKSVNLSAVNRRRQIKLFGSTIVSQSGAQIASNYQNVSQQIVETAEQVIIELNKQFPLPTAPDDKIHSKKEMKVFFDRNPLFSKMLVEKQKLKTFKTEESQNGKHKQRKRKVGASEVEEAIQIAVDAAWFRCYQKRLDMMSEDFCINSRCGLTPNIAQVQAYIDSKGWTPKIKRRKTDGIKKDDESSKLVKQIQRRCKMMTKNQPEATREATRNTRNATRLKMTFNYSGNNDMEKLIDRCISKQTWDNLAILENAVDKDGNPMGRGVVTTAWIRKGSIVCDYHQTAKDKTNKRNSSIMLEEADNIASNMALYMVFSKHGPEVYNAFDEACPCHPGELLL